jgi:hypothetical protein
MPLPLNSRPDNSLSAFWQGSMILGALSGNFLVLAMGRGSVLTRHTDGGQELGLFGFELGLFWPFIGFNWV